MLEVYCSQSRQLVPFTPLENGKVKMYVCGPTVYDSCHIGHARPAVVFDVIRRYLEFVGYDVTFISNITDIDDKIIKRAAELGITCEALAEKYRTEYVADMQQLNVLSPTVCPLATEHIAEMIKLIETLVNKGMAYTTSRGVWFEVAKFPRYGCLSGKFTDDDKTEHRVEQDPEKHNAADFALWKFSKPSEPQWDSPWGKGRPGWHIECSAMAGKHCAMQLDIHGGGADLLFPHHENELAQSEAASGKPFVKYWLHNGFITIAKADGAEDKMGKSKGNALGLREAFKVAGAAAVRYWILGTHYRKPLMYKPELLTSAKNSLERIYACLEALTKLNNEEKEAARIIPEPVAQIKQNFITAMNDDFNTPQALAEIFALVTLINKEFSALTNESAVVGHKVLMELLEVLGLPQTRPNPSGDIDENTIKNLIEERTAAKKNKDFKTADEIRQKLATMKVEIKDTPTGTTWAFK